MAEHWKDIQGYEGRYQISSYGRVKALKRPYKSKPGYRPDYFLKPGIGNKKYAFIALCMNGICISKNIHRLVAMAFIPNPENKPMVNHKDGNKVNNNVENLEWCTGSENFLHACETGLFKNAFTSGEKGPGCKLTKEQVKEIRAIRALNIYTFKQIGQMFNVSNYAIKKIIYRKTWASI